METNTKQIVSCVANYAYDASEPNELTIRPGDVLRDVERLSGGFWRGELHGRHGLFPDNFVSLLTEQPTARPGGAQGRCRAIFSYQPANADELPLFEGDVLEVLEEVEEGWWRGIRAGREGVFPSNFVVMLDPPSQPAPSEPAPALPPKPVKEQCRVLFPYTAVNYDELTLAEGDIVNILSKDAPDRGWWNGEVNGRSGYFPDNFVQLLPPVAQDVEEKKPDRPPNKTSSIYPVLHKLTEKSSSVKELTTSRISKHKENTASKDIQTTVTHTNNSDAEESEATEWGADGQIKKPPVPLKKSPTPISGVGGLLSGLKHKIMSSSEKTERSTVTVTSSSTVSGTASSVSSGGSGGSSTGEWDRPDGGAGSKPAPAPASAPAPGSASTFDHIERNSILNDPRAGRVKAPRRRPPSQALRDDTPQQIGLSNGHEVPTDNTSPAEKKEEIQPRAREWTKHRAPWMEELKLNQAKKTDGKGRSSTTSTGSTDRIVECGLEERKSSHSMEMSKSTSSISSRISVIEHLETSLDVKTRHSMDNKKDVPPELPTSKPPPIQSPTASGRTISTMLDDIKKPVAPPPPVPSQSETPDKSPSTKSEHVTEKHAEGSAISKFSASSLEKIQSHSERTEKIQSHSERVEKIQAHSERAEKIQSHSERAEKIQSHSERAEKFEKIPDRTSAERSSGTLERRGVMSYKTERQDASEALIAQLNIRILNLEKLIEVQNAKFTAAIEDLNYRLNSERTKRQALQSDMEKLAHCVTQV